MTTKKETALCGIDDIDYVPFGMEWEKEIMKMKKSQIVQKLREAHLEIRKLKEGRL